MKLLELKEILTNEISKGYELFHNLIISDISIDKQITTNNPFYTGTQKENKKEFKATFIINKKEAHQFLKENVGETNNGSAKYDITIDKIYLSSSMSLMVVAKKITETGISQRELQKRKLHKYCSENNIYSKEKKILSGFVLNILAITSKTSSISSDITNNTGLKNTDKIHIIKCETSQEIATTIKTFSTSEKYDIIVLHRGGREDEQMGIFSSIDIIDAITKSKIPIVSALGHEQDKPFITQITDIDYSTPSAFAKEIKSHNALCIEKKQDSVKNITNTLKQISKDLILTPKEILSNIEYSTKEIKNNFEMSIYRANNKISADIESIKKNQRYLIKTKETNIITLSNKIKTQLLHKCDDKDNKIKSYIIAINSHQKIEIKNKLDSIEKHAQAIHLAKKHFQEIEKLNKQIKIGIVVVVILLVIAGIYLFATRG